MRRFSLEKFLNALTRLAMIWILFEKTRSIQAIAMLSRAYDMPIRDGCFFAELQLPSSYKEKP